MISKQKMLITTLLVAFSVVAASIWSFGATTSVQSESTSGGTEGIGYHSMVEVYKNGELVSRQHNVLFIGGNETIETALKGGTIGNVSVISLCNATTLGETSACATPISAGTAAFKDFTGCGLTNATGLISDRGTGNYSASYEWTSTCDNRVTNVTLLTNGTTNFAGTTFTSVTLQTNDKLNVTWYVWIS